MFMDLKMIIMREHVEKLNIKNRNKAPKNNQIEILELKNHNLDVEIYGGGGGLVPKWCLALCDCMDCSPPGSSVHGILQARILEWVAISFSRGSSRSRDWTWVSCLAGGFFTTEPIEIHRLGLNSRLDIAKSGVRNKLVEILQP